MTEQFPTIAFFYDCTETYADWSKNLPDPWDITSEEIQKARSEKFKQRDRELSKFMRETESKVRENAPSGATHYQVKFGAPAWTNDQRYMTPCAIKYSVRETGRNWSDDGWWAL